MSWIVVLIVTLFTPLVQPVIQHGAQRVQARLQQNQPQYVSQPPYFVYHEGRWWKFENNQWYVYVENK